MPTRRRNCQAIRRLVCLLLLTTVNCRANLDFTGSVTTAGGLPWAQGLELTIGYSGDGHVLLDNRLDGNAITKLRCPIARVACGSRTTASLAFQGSGCQLEMAAYSTAIHVAEGADSHGILTLSSGFKSVDNTSANRNIFLGVGAGSRGEMFLRDPGTRLLLADWLHVGQNNGASGQLLVSDGGECEVYGIRIGYAAGALGRAVVAGSGSVLKNWGNERSAVGWSGNGNLTVQDRGLVSLRYVCEIGYANGSHGEVLVTGSGSRLEVTTINVGRGDAATLPTPPGEGVLRLARGGVVQASSAFNVGYSGYKPKGTLVFTIGSDGSGSVACGRAEVAGTVLLDVATLLMQADAGLSLPPGHQFTLVNYATLGRMVSGKPANHRFVGVPEGGVILTPNHHAFRINYATDLGDGDLAITATVVEPPVEDSDGDGLLDAWELRCFGAIDAPAAGPLLDPDGDGRNNLTEHVAGTDPLDPADHCAIALAPLLDDGVMELTYTPYEPTVSCQLEVIMDPAAGWSEASQVETRVEGGSLILKLDKTQYPAMFLRVRIAR